MKIRALLARALAAALLSGALAAPALAQQPSPPEHYTLDPRGVDLVNGTFSTSAVDVAIGMPGDGGIVHGRVYANGGWRDTLVGTIDVSGSAYLVSLGAESEVFIKSGSTFTPQSENGSSLTQSGSALTFTTANGAVAVFSTTYSGNTSPYDADGAVILSYTAPNGETTTWHWVGVSYCRLRDLDGNCLDYANATRPQGVSNNRGYLVKFLYASDTPPSDFPTDWLKRTGAIGVNLAVEYCDPGGNGCPGLTGDWPEATYQSSGPRGTSIQSVTDVLGRTTTYGYSGGFSIRAPGQTADQVTVTTNAGKVSSVVGPDGTWTYAYADSGPQRTTTVAAPDGQTLTVVSDLTIGRATSVTNGTGDETTYAYDAERRLDVITNPQDGTSNLDYDARGNVVMVTSTASG